MRTANKLLEEEYIGPLSIIRFLRKKISAHFVVKTNQQLVTLLQDRLFLSAMSVLISVMKYWLRMLKMPNKALQSDKVNLSCHLLAQKLRQIAFAAELNRYVPRRIL